MHASYWQLNESPFRHASDTRFFFPSPSHDEALARLHFLVNEQRQLGVLTGDDGNGKTLLLKVLGNQLRQLGRVVCRVNLLGLDEHGFFWSVAAGLDLNPDSSDDAFALWRRISDRIQENVYQNITTVLLLDDVHLAERALLNSVLRLLKTHPEKLVVVLATDVSGMMRLVDLLPLCELRSHLDSWDLDDTGEYLRTSLSLAGRDDPIFDDGAINRIYELAGGIPRHVCQLAEMALLAGAGQEVEIIDTAIIESVFLELGVADPHAAEVALV